MWIMSIILRRDSALMTFPVQFTILVPNRPKAVVNDYVSYDMIIHLFEYIKWLHKIYCIENDNYLCMSKKIVHIPKGVHSKTNRGNLLHLEHHGTLSVVWPRVASISTGRVPFFIFRWSLAMLFECYMLTPQCYMLSHPAFYMLKSSSCILHGHSS